MAKAPKAALRYMAEFEETEDDLLRLVGVWVQAFNAVPDPGTDLKGWIALKMGCTPREAGTVLKWAFGADRP